MGGNGGDRGNGGNKGKMVKTGWKMGRGGGAPEHGRNLERNLKNIRSSSSAALNSLCVWKARCRTGPIAERLWTVLESDA